MLERANLEEFPLWVGVDTGGTFTDFAVLMGGRLLTHKVLSTPQAPERAILQGLAELKLPLAQARITHGTTVATNAALENKGARTVYITNRGFKDVLTLGRQDRPELYNLAIGELAPPVPPELCLEVDCRRGADGAVVTPLGADEVARLTAQVEGLAPEAVAVNLLFSYLQPAEEQAIGAALAEVGYVALSSEVLPEAGEYERGIATWLNAALGPKVAHYLRRLQAGVAPARVAVMQSSGRTVAATEAAQRAVHLLLSGPAGGLAAAMRLGRAAGETRLLTFDMGGTSTDVALLDGAIGLTSEGRLGPYPVAVPMVDMHTIGAGGGSIAFVDAGGMLQVGPRSAGASPGPACYGQGGEAPTVTDANAVLGRLPPAVRLAGGLPLDYGAARRAVGQVAVQLGLDIEAAAAGIVALANEHMAAALRKISVERGFDPREYTLCCFGGAGGLHACAVAEALAIPKILVPAAAGVFSAYGLLLAAPGREYTRTLNRPLPDLTEAELNCAVAELRAQAIAALASEADQLTITTAYHCRYRGQSATLRLPGETPFVQLSAAFHRAHDDAFGFELDLPVELYTLHLSAEGVAPEFIPPPAPVVHGEPLATEPLAVYDFDGPAPGCAISGPAVLIHSATTVFIAEDWRGRRDEVGHWWLERH